jgi:hypothetical protein
MSQTSFSSTPFFHILYLGKSVHTFAPFAMLLINGEPQSPTSRIGQGLGLRIQKSKKSYACSFGKMQRFAWA